MNILIISIAEQGDVYILIQNLPIAKFGLFQFKIVQPIKSSHKKMIKIGRVWEKNQSIIKFLIRIVIYIDNDQDNHYQFFYHYLLQLSQPPTLFSTCY